MESLNARCYYIRDHLGSVREMTDTTGAIQARYDYDPYGRVTQIAGSMASDFQYAGYYKHQWCPIFEETVCCKLLV